MNRQVVLRLSGVTKRFGDLLANDGIDLTLYQGEVIALLGENGAGKTTLMNILFGHYVADAGEVEAFGAPLPAGNPRAALEAGIGMVHQHFTLAENLTVAENIVLGTGSLWRGQLGLGKVKKRIIQLAEDFGLGVQVDARVGDLSVGEKQRVEILKALYRKARVLILDEPTAVLTPQETDALFDTLRKAVAQGLSIVFISHKLHEIMAIADRCLVLRHGVLVGEVATQETSRAALAEMMVGNSIAAPEITTAATGETLLELKNVSVPDRETATGLHRIHLSLKAGQITGLAGVSGNGQAVLFDVISGLFLPKEGQLTLAGVAVEDWNPRQAVQHGIARIPEDRHHTGTIADFDLRENAILERYREISQYGWMDWREAQAFTEEIIQDYDVRCSGADSKIRLLSGGNMQKLILGRVLAGNPKVILANQPVRGLDIGAITYVHNRLLAARDAGAAILLISEDLDEILRLSDVVQVISEGRLSPEFPRGTKTPTELGLWMAGQGFDGDIEHAA